MVVWVEHASIRIVGRDKRAREFGHIGLAEDDRMCAAQQPDHLDKLDVEPCPALGQRLNRRRDPLDRAGVVGAPDVDQLIGALCLLKMIGEIGAEIGPFAARFADRAVLIVAEPGRAEQRRLNRSWVHDPH